MNQLKKYFGMGMIGAGISLALLAVAWAIDHFWSWPGIMTDRVVLGRIGAVLMALGLGLHIWSFATLRNWWFHDRLCTGGPFRFVRHPMYAAWITLICPGLALELNSWPILVWAVCLHPLWHVLVWPEERLMAERFGEDYQALAARTGRFIPRPSFSAGSKTRRKDGGS
ncbi:MAG: isoprenylcysteine carboxylmethyltransferase family protein [Proteobacteria bacterium]|nr:isoprenylcysteine carboxylmethyltransferase family protein [Pseudomonadota bacterium]